MVNLLLKTEYTFLKVYGQIGKIIAALDGATAAGICDDNTWGHIPWFNACKKAGIKPLLGVNLVVQEKIEQEADSMNRMSFLAKSNAGLEELYQLTTLAESQKYYSARLSFDQVLGISDQIIIFNNSFAPPILKDLKCLYLDVNPASKIAIWKQIELSQKLGRPIVAQCDNRYPRREDKPIFEMLEGRTALTPQFILTEAQLRRELPKLDDSAFSESDRIAAMCDVTLPKAENLKAKGRVETLCRKGIIERGMTDTWNDLYEERLQRELKMIREKKFTDYFLIISDMVREAKKTMLVGPARGSAAGSLVCYLLFITEVDPLRFNLIFERFIDITRADLPDIDLDFPDSRREQVIEYLRQKYGAERIAHIGTVSRYQPKSVLIDVGKKLQIKPSELKPVKEAIIERSGGDSRASFCLADTFNTLDVGKQLLEKYPGLALAAELEDHARHSGVHAAGIIVCDDKVSKYCTVNREGVAQIDKKDAEKINLLKIDILGLRTLSVLMDAIDIGKIDVDLYKVPLDDPKVFEVFAARKFAGIFQFEGPALQSVCLEMGCEKFDDVVALTALARPGPINSGGTRNYVRRRRGEEEIVYTHELVRKHTEETYGIVCFQEQLMSIGREVGRLSWETVSELRRAVSKSLGEEFFNQYWDKFRDGAIENGISEKQAKEIWDTICTFGSWAFNKCISGNTKIWLSASNQDSPTTIEQMWKMYHGKKVSPWCKTRANKGNIGQMWSLDANGKFVLCNVKKIHKNGKKDCWRYSFSDGSKIECTPEHRFIINGKWQRAAKAQIGSHWAAGMLDIPKVEKKGNAARGKHWKIGPDGDRHGAANPAFINGASVMHAQFVAEHSGDPCEDCGADHQRMEAHHNDFNHGKDRPDDLAWLCPGCHKKRHYAQGRTKRGEKGLAATYKRLVSAEPIGERETYDIEMVTEPHNFVLANGLITHNSHAVSYGLLSYWCAWIKAHHPLAFAAACLRNAKDDEQTIKLLRELVTEGFTYVPFDRERSEMNWSVQDGTLYGGLLGIKGIGESKAKDILHNRANGGLTKEQEKLLANPDIFYANIFPTRRRWGHLYDDPEGNNIDGPISFIKDLEQPGEYCIIGRLVIKNLRNINEYTSVARRGGKVYAKDTDWLLLTVEDDTGQIACMIGRFQYARMGKQIVESGELGSWWLIRGKINEGFHVVNVTKIKRLDDEQQAAMAPSPGQQTESQSLALGAN